MISYELSMGLAVVGVLILSSSLRLSEIVAAQTGISWVARDHPAPQVVHLRPTAGFSHLLRMRTGGDEPGAIDLPEAETELVRDEDGLVYRASKSVPGVLPQYQGQGIGSASYVGLSPYGYKQDFGRFAVVSVTQVGGKIGPANRKW
jgi:hypothetical protein